MKSNKRTVINMKDLNEMVLRTVKGVMREWHDDTEMPDVDTRGDMYEEELSIPLLYQEAMNNGVDDLVEYLDGEWSDFANDEGYETIGECDPKGATIYVRVGYTKGSVAGGDDILEGTEDIEFDEEDRPLYKWSRFIMDNIDSFLV